MWEVLGEGAEGAGRQVAHASRFPFPRVKWFAAANQPSGAWLIVQLAQLQLRLNYNDNNNTNHNII